MSDKPILFNPEMVRAILAGRKTQTRRSVKVLCGVAAPAPYKVGDVLYVRETWTTFQNGYVYRADLRTDDGRLWPDPLPPNPDMLVWHPSIHMPKSAARIWLWVRRVAMQNVADISEVDAKAEGVTPLENESYQAAFLRVWRDIYGDDAKEAWVIEFERVDE